MDVKLPARRHLAKSLLAAAVWISASASASPSVFACKKLAEPSVRTSARFGERPCALIVSREILLGTTYNDGGLISRH